MAMLKVESGPSGMLRYTLLLGVALETLREYYKRYKPEDWLFPGGSPTAPLSPRSAQGIFEQAKTRKEHLLTNMHCI